MQLHTLDGGTSPGNFPSGIILAKNYILSNKTSNPQKTFLASKINTAIVSSSNGAKWVN